MADIQLYYVHSIDENRALGDENEARHLSRVMRKQVGDLAYITAGDGNMWQAEILDLGRSKVLFKPLKLIKQETKPARIAIAVAPTKQASRIEDLLEKGVEIGLTDLYLIRSERTQRKEFKTHRLRKMAVSAMKQCLRLHETRIHEMTSYNDFLSESASHFQHRYTGKIDGENPYLLSLSSIGDTVILIGPEGDFTEDEYQRAVAAGFDYVKLSESRLRTETAGLIAIAQVLDSRLLQR